MKKYRIGILILASFLFVFTINNFQKAYASIPETFYTKKQLKKLDFKNRTIPKKYRGTWYMNNTGDIEKYKITTHKISGESVKVSSKRVKVRGIYRLPIYNNTSGLSYLGVKNNKLFSPVILPNMSNKLKLPTKFTMDSISYKSSSKAKMGKKAYLPSYK